MTDTKCDKESVDLKSRAHPAKLLTYIKKSPKAKESLLNK